MNAKCTADNGMMWYLESALCCCQSIIIDLLFIDKSDNHLDKEIKSIIRKTFFTNILMKDQNDKLNLSKKILEVSRELIN